MPNHVYNTMTVTGTPEAIKAFKEKARHEDREFSYWNFITPPQEAIDSGEYEGTHGWEGGESKGNTPNNWYNFNRREWGTKWDAYEVCTDFVLEDSEFQVQWVSAWGEPMPVFVAMVEQHPELEFDFSWQEEQGWGGEAIGAGGDFSIGDEWEIPNSHEDCALRGTTCACEWADEPTDFYPDCPDYVAPSPEMVEEGKKQEEEMLSKMREAIIEKSGVSTEWADKHLVVMGVK